MANEETSTETPEVGITADDCERIRAYLDKPAHCRSEGDLVPDD